MLVVIDGDDGAPTLEGGDDDGDDGPTLEEGDGLASGAYAVSLFHDENGNGRLDTILGIPREGFGFSRNPPIRFGPPRFDAARFAVTSGEAAQQVRLKYLL